MREYARVCQIMPEYARVCQIMPKYARVCQSMPEYANIGSSRLPKWIKIEDGEIRRSNCPQEFIPASHSKEKQIVTKENDIFSQKQKVEFRIFNIIQNTR